MFILKIQFRMNGWGRIIQALNNSSKPHNYLRNIATYSSEEESKILKIVNESDAKILVKHGISKLRLQNIVEWRETKGKFYHLQDVLIASGISERVANKFFNNILVECNPQTVKVLESLPKKSAVKKIRGQVLQPPLPDKIKNDINSVVSLHLTMSAVSWCSIRRQDYNLQAWGHHTLTVPDDTKLHMPAIIEIAWSIVSKIPRADVYVLEGLPTTLRAGGSDPYNPKVISVNLQKSQLIAMIFALLNGRRNTQKYSNPTRESEENETNNADFQHRVYMLRASLPARVSEESLTRRIAPSVNRASKERRRRRIVEAEVCMKGLGY